MKNVAVLVSGGGTNLQTLIDYEKQNKDCPYHISVVLSNTKNAYALERAKLAGKGIRPHTLVMSATPIPRTLGLIIYGDLDISIINERNILNIFFIMLPLASIYIIPIYAFIINIIGFFYCLVDNKSLINSSIMFFLTCCITTI